MGLDQRKNYLINKDFQFKFILYTFIPSVLSLGLFYTSLNIYFSKLILQGETSGLPMNHPYFTLIADQKMIMNKLFMICSVVLFLLFVIWGLFISHKIAGPLYRLKKFFEDSQSDPFSSRISFRPGDFFQEIPTAINSWMDANAIKFKK